MVSDDSSFITGQTVSDILVIPLSYLSHMLGAADGGRRQTSRLSVVSEAEMYYATVSAVLTPFILVSYNLSTMTGAELRCPGTSFACMDISSCHFSSQVEKSHHSPVYELRTSVAGVSGVPSSASALLRRTTVGDSIVMSPVVCFCLLSATVASTLRYRRQTQCCARNKAWIYALQLASRDAPREHGGC